MITVAGDGWSSWPAPAKLNLFLRIVGRRSDGYHLLQTVFQLLDWGDTVHIRSRDDGRIHRAGGGTALLPEADDLLLRAARKLKEATGTRMGADLHVDKRIPVGGGFGGGSSNAATVLVALNEIWATGLDRKALAGLGLELGADVPVFVWGENAWAESLGEQLTALELPLAWYLMADPGLAVPTGELFQAAELTRDAPPATIADFVSGAELGNAFEPVLRRLQPPVDALLSELSRFGKARLTGTGSGCFLQFNSREEALEVQAKLPVSLRSWIAAGAAQSGLRRAQEAFAAAG